MLKEAIAKNRYKQARYKKYEKVLRQLRLRIFDYEDAGKGEKASALMARCKVILAPYWQAQHDARTQSMTDRMMRTWE